MNARDTAAEVRGRHSYGEGVAANENGSGRACVGELVKCYLRHRSG